ncbi:MAG: ABC transporter permease [Xanthomonadales bacterium]|nr:ABC transporter permease [Xanthomonadales bacterium]
MFGYYFALALRSLKRNKILTALMVVAIALGIGAAMTTLTVLHVLSGDPLPGRSAQIYAPQIDPQELRGHHAGKEPPDQVGWIDGMNLLHAKRADRQALMYGGSVQVDPVQSNLEPFFESARFTSSDFFAMFGVRFEYGHAWAATDDEAHAHVAVISRKLNDKLFAGKDSTGKTLHLGEHDLRIVGVIDDWRPNPHFYDLYTGSYGQYEGVFLPLTSAMDLELSREGSMDCWGKGAPSPDKLKTATCTWLQFWVQLDTPAKAAAYKQFLVHYSQQQKSMGRFERPPNVRLRNLSAWLDYHKVVPGDVRLQTWLAFGFLLVCLVNTVGLLLAKFLRRSAELGVRRALGASRLEVFSQLLIEAGVVGLVGGAGGLLLALLGLWLVRQQPADYAALAHLDLRMLAVTIALSVGATLLAGALPAWRACQITPALQLKSN